MRLFEPKIDFAHAATSSIRLVIFQRANSGANSARVKNPMHGNAPYWKTSPRAKRRAKRIAATHGISGPSMANAVSCQVRRMRQPAGDRYRVASNDLGNGFLPSRLIIPVVNDRHSRYEDPSRSSEADTASETIQIIDPDNSQCRKRWYLFRTEPPRKSGTKFRARRSYQC